MANKRMNEEPPSHIDIVLDLNDLKTSAPRLACLARTDWINLKIDFKQLTDGISNRLLAMFPQEKDQEGLIVRIYGENSDLIIDREAEIRTMVRLSKLDMANEVLLRFNNGFLYTYLPGEQIDINDQKMEPLVAQTLAKFHSIPFENEGEKQKSQLIDKLIHYFNLLNGKNAQLRERVESMKSPSIDLLRTVKTTIGLQSSPPSLDSIESLIDYSWSELDDDLGKIESIFNENWFDVPIVFCHNDTQSTNFLFDNEKKMMRMVDFEHCFPNYYLFDITNHFVEYAGLGSSPDWKNKYPTKQQQKTFLSEYLQHALFLSEENIEKLCARCDQLVPLTHLYWSLWALIQSLVNPEALSQFDYVTYGKSRFNQYKLHKNKFLHL